MIRRGDSSPESLDGLISLRCIQFKNENLLNADEENQQCCWLLHSYRSRSFERTLLIIILMAIKLMIKAFSNTVMRLYSRRLMRVKTDKNLNTLLKTRTGTDNVFCSFILLGREGRPHWSRSAYKEALRLRCALSLSLSCYFHMLSIDLRPEKRISILRCAPKSKPALSISSQTLYHQAQ